MYFKEIPLKVQYIFLYCKENVQEKELYYFHIFSCV